MRLDKLRHALEYVQDFIGIESLKMWNSELSRLILFNVNREGDAKKLLRERLEDEISLENKNLSLVEIPSYEPLDNENMTFMGRLLSAIINITRSTRNIVYIPNSNAWYSLDAEVAFSPKTLTYLIPAIGVIGINGLDKLISYNLARELNKFNKTYMRKADSSVRGGMGDFIRGVGDTMKFDENTRKDVETLFNTMGYFSRDLIVAICKIGHYQLIRKVLLHELAFMSKVDSKGLHSTIANINKSMILKLTDQKKEINSDYDAQKELERKEIAFMEEVSKYSDMLGISNSFNKMYTEFKQDMPYFSLALSIVTIGSLPQLYFEKKYSAIIKRNKSDQIDGSMLLAGIITLLHHTHSEYTKEYISFLAQYGKSAIFRAFHGHTRAPKELPPSTQTLLVFCEEFCKFSNLSPTLVKTYLSPFFFHSFPH